MEQILSTIQITTKGEGFTEITNNLNKFLNNNNLSTGILILNSLHTSCSLIINENADPNVLVDLQNYIKAIIPFKSYCDLTRNNKEIYYEHYQEGEDDMPAHIKTALTNTSLSLSFKGGKLILGAWQAIYLWEHRFGIKIRTLNIHVIGEKM
tara:strand:+ start:4814 stop:5269 length:456 start_codon:yes stop_codon:yes gene_type:complete